MQQCNQLTWIEQRIEVGGRTTQKGIHTNDVIKTDKRLLRVDRRGQS